jgi:hypothetical protein
MRDATAMPSPYDCTQESGFHPLHPEIGGLAITQMDQLAELSLQDSILSSVISPAFLGQIESTLTSSRIPLDYQLVWAVLIATEIFALVRNWTR